MRAPARRDRQPARRRGAVRGAGLAGRRRGAAGHALAAAPAPPAPRPARRDAARSQDHVWPLLRDLLPTESRADDGFAEARGTDPRRRARAAAHASPRRSAELRGAAAPRGARGAGRARRRPRSATTSRRWSATTGRERWANVRKLMRLAREFESREGPDLAAFLDYLGSRAASRDREAEAATRAEGHAGVRIMTVHAAKGLEFGIVAVPDLGRSLHLGWIPLRVEAGEERPDGDGVRAGRRPARAARAALRAPGRLRGAGGARRRPRGRGGGPARLRRRDPGRSDRLLLSGTFTRRL